jgi:hypothetical protein
MTQEIIDEIKELIDCLVAASITYGNDLDDNQKLQTLKDRESELIKSVERIFK